MLVVEPDYLLDSEVFVFSMFIPHEDFTPQNNVHPPWGSCRGASPLTGSRGKRDGGFGGEAPEGKIAL
jgi:hypothetical protein